MVPGPRAAPDLPGPDKRLRREVRVAPEPRGLSVRVLRVRRARCAATEHERELFCRFRPRPEKRRIEHEHGGISCRKYFSGVLWLWGGALHLHGAPVVLPTLTRNLKRDAQP